MKRKKDKNEVKNKIKNVLVRHTRSSKLHAHFSNVRDGQKEHKIKLSFECEKLTMHP